MHGSAEFATYVFKRLTYRPPSGPCVVAAHQLVNEVTRAASVILAAYLPQSRELSMAISSLELARMQANQAVALGQVPLDVEQVRMVCAAFTLAANQALDEIAQRTGDSANLFETPQD